MTTSAPDVGPLHGLTDDQLALRSVIRQIAGERVAPRGAAIDAHAELPTDVRRLFADQDLFGLPFDEAYGGTGTGPLMLCVAIEQVVAARASSALLLAVRDLGSQQVFDGVRVAAADLIGAEGEDFMEVTVEAVQVLGGYGYVTGYPVERMMRVAKLTRIYEDTNGIQRVVVARARRG